MRLIPLLLPTLAKVPTVLVLVSESFVPSDDPVVCVSPVKSPLLATRTSFKGWKNLYFVIPVDSVLDVPKVSLSDELELLLSE